MGNFQTELVRGRSYGSSKHNSIFTWTWLRNVRFFAIANPSVVYLRSHERYRWQTDRQCVCLSSVTFVRPTQGLKLSATFLRHSAP